MPKAPKVTKVLVGAAWLLDVSALELVSMVAVSSIYAMNKAYYIYAADHRTEAQVSTFTSIKATRMTERPFVCVRLHATVFRRVR